MQNTLFLNGGVYWTMSELSTKKTPMLTDASARRRSNQRPGTTWPGRSIKVFIPGKQPWGAQYVTSRKSYFLGSPLDCRKIPDRGWMTILSSAAGPIGVLAERTPSSMAMSIVAKKPHAV